eukprot:14864_1
MESKGENTYPIIPKFRKKFKPLQVKDIIENELRGKLENEKYHVDKAAKQAREITDAIKKKLKELGWDRYKFVVQTVIGEQRGEGVKMG